MGIRRPNLGKLTDPRVRAALYYARKRRLRRLAGDGGFNNRFDQSFVPTGWSAVGNTITNVSAGNQFALFGVVSDPLPVGKSYWEIVYAGGLPSNSYVGITPEANLSDFNSTTNGTALYQPGIGWASNGQLGLDSGVTSSALPTWVSGDVLRFAYDSVTGEFWVGINTTAPNVAGAPATTTLLVNPYITVGLRLNGLSATVLTGNSLNYPAPTGFTAVGR